MRITALTLVFQMLSHFFLLLDSFAGELFETFASEFLDTLLRLDPARWPRRS